jgi:hypothetical protein
MTHTHSNLIPNTKMAITAIDLDFEPPQGSEPQFSEALPGARLYTTWSWHALNART